MTKRQRQDAHHWEVVSVYYQTGDEAALGPMLAEVRTRLLALARGTFGVTDQERAEDLAQETIAYVLGSLRAKKYEPIGTLTAYAGTHLRFLFLSSRRYRPSDPGADEDPFRTVGDVLTFEHVAPSEQAEAATAVAAATQAVLGLDPAARAAVVLHFYQGLPAEQAAHQLGLSAESYRARLDRGLQTLRSWSQHQPRPSADMYAALRHVDTGNLFQEPLRLAG